jgi:hypothetical protein
MEVGDDEVLTLAEAAERLGVQRASLAKQARRGVLKARLAGNVYLITGRALKDYERDHLGKSGFASPDHPLHGKPRGGRPKRDA